MVHEILTDFTSYVYLFETLICYFGFAVFIWWWIRQKTASEVYAYITFLLLATGMERMIALIVRITSFYDLEKAKEAIFSPAWSLRTVPGTIVMVLIVYRMANRAWRTVRLEKRYQGKEEGECFEEEEDGR